MTEIWKDIKNYEGLYQISNYGRVKSLERKIYKGHGERTAKEHILKPSKVGNGYLHVNLWKNNKQTSYLVHRLVAEAFIPNPKGFSEINHKDETQTNNYVDNLEWCTREYNLNYGTHNQKVAKANSKPVLCVETGKIYQSLNEIGRIFGYGVGNIWSCCKGKLKSAYGYHWQYVA